MVRLDSATFRVCRRFPLPRRGRHKSAQGKATRARRAWPPPWGSYPTDSPPCARRGSPTPPKRPTVGLLRRRRPAVGTCGSVVRPATSPVLLCRPCRASVGDALCTQGGAPQLSLLRSALGWFVLPLRDGTEMDVGLLEGDRAALVWIVSNSCCVVFMGASIVLHTRRGNGGNGVRSGSRPLLHRLPLRGTERAESVK